MSTVRRMAVLVLGLVAAAARAANVGDPPSWNLLNLDFGTGPGQTSVAASFDVLDGALSETQTADTSLISYVGAPGIRAKHAIGAVGDHTYEVAMSVPWSGNIEVRMLAALGSSWDYRWQNSGVYLKDYDGAVLSNPSNCLNKTRMNVYRVVVEGGTFTMYLNNDPAPMPGMTVLTGSGGGWLDFFWWLDGGSADPVEMDYVRVASGAWIPGGESPNMRNSANWDGRYEADAMPDVESGFSPDGGIAAHTAVANGLCRIDGSQGGLAHPWPAWLLTGSGWVHPSDNWSLEYRVRVVQFGPEHQGSGGPSAIYGDADSWHTVGGICAGGNDGFYGSFNNGQAGNKWYTYGTVDLTQWNTVRATYYQTGPDAYNLSIYLNDDPTPFFTGVGDSGRTGDGDRLAWGLKAHPTTLVGGIVEWDWVRWTKKGAFAPAAPVPPGTVIVVR